MGLKSFVYTTIVVLVILVGIKINSLLQVPQVSVPTSVWWGPAEKQERNTTIIPFKINVEDSVLLDLRSRLISTRKLTPPLEGTQQQYGFNTNTLKAVLDYWLNDYNWKQREKYLNQFPQFQTNIQGLNIHYLHVKPTVTEDTLVYPLLILHGWPGSVREFYKIIPILTKIHKKFGFAFEVIAPSLPGYAFSDAAVKPGLGPTEIAVIFRNLMKRIGFEKYYVQGGDWGAAIIKNMATLFPENILGLHTNMAVTNGPLALLKLLLGSICPRLIISKEYEDMIYPLKKLFEAFLEESGYMHLQATKPDTLGVGIRDSPAGLAAYILEKFSTLTNPSYRYREDAGLLDKFTYEELIDNIMIYWITGSFTSACRIYKEGFSGKDYKFERISIDEKVPCAIARFRHEVVFLPEYILTDKYSNIIQVSDFKEGGHFAALEVPTLLTEDIFLAVSKMHKLYQN